MFVKFTADPRIRVAGKLADAEIHFTEGPLAGMKLVGFAVWERRGGGKNVTLPSRQYVVNGQRLSYTLLRPANEAAYMPGVRDFILEAFAVWLERPETVEFP